MGARAGKNLCRVCLSKLPQVFDHGIAIRAIGGLGNQLFQYAVGRSMAVRLGGQLYVDSRGYKKNKNRPFLLNHFNHHAILIERTYLPLRISKFLRKNFEVPRLERQGRYVDEVASDAIAQVKNAALGQYFNGFWQDPAYFSDVESLLREELTFATSPSFKNEEMRDRIANCCAVSVHIRRGDYLTIPHHKLIFASCGPAYYANAIATISSKLTQAPVFFVFSDDLKWVQENIAFPENTVFVTINDDASSWEDLRLMAACQHHIIANSTFSWWGAWLNASLNKIVVAPRYWYKADVVNRSPLLLRDFVLVENDQNLV